MSGGKLGVVAAAPAAGATVVSPRPPSPRGAGGFNLLVLPALIMFLAFALIPMVGVLVLSFTSWDGISPITFTGLASWQEMLTDPGLYHSLAVTFAVMICSWLVQTPISLLLGTFVAGRQRYRALLAVLYFLPLLMSSAAVAIAFKSLLDPYFGLGAGLHLEFLSQDWLGDPQLAFGVVIFVIAWQFVPFHTLIYQGGVRQIPGQLYEAAQIDGAGRIRQFFSITIPQLKYTIITSSTLILVGSLTYFDLIFVLTGGGPGNATRILALDMYIRGFQANQMGAASVIGVFLVALGLILTLGIQRLGGRDRSASQMEGM
ncbi:MAG TPA: sugar ABC transporter permease [Microlunatus sp.]